MALNTWQQSNEAGETLACLHYCILLANEGSQGSRLGLLASTYVECDTEQDIRTDSHCCRVMGRLILVEAVLHQQAE